nr:MAG TPA: hypothetical protein [Caudoviricetes sp.]
MFEVQNLSHDQSAFFGVELRTLVSSRRPAVRRADASTSSSSSSSPAVDQWPLPVGNGMRTV